ncbi:5-formyltetrahydrofolate cyclo-ligase [Fusibacter ferrireducens]|uniref:5-formyltetrahydrofolate cyclo-ligase n=1 Tax=Fusibacter ferrireducens TaxID=2785058 RepID=A0ABS0A0E5_9FIRM|nr:5-formyltetrahydrofolate cyclo-ligase [Fusibacter ferrireducens]MBF4695359.1 5-formyltetrahydrofolate cyclo-ligase [Fusibacter ferrireducens]
MDKKQIRQNILKARAALSEQERTDYSQKIMSYLIHSDVFKKASQVASFVDFRNEVCMMPINDYILDQGKSLCLPYIDMKSKTMTFHKVQTLSELKLSTYGILEPDPKIHPQVDLSQINLVLTPGVAFDDKGFRIGYGGGFYDRFFEKLNPEIFKFGIAFSIQQLNAIPLEPHDLPLTALITEKGIQKF